MLIRRTLEELPALETPLHLALGVFDGVHIGHQAVIGRAVDAAAREGGIAGVVTFDPHPIRVIAPDKAPSALLATLDHKKDIIQGLDAGLFVPLRFDLEFAAMEAGDFLSRLLAAPVHTIAVGEDWRFGHGRHGDTDLLLEAARRHGFRLEAVPPVMLDGDRVSSTRIRQAIRDGNVSAAARLLGRPHSIGGTVIHGRQLARQLGFPTANLAVGDTQLPPDGVWKIRALLPGGHTRTGVANLGVRPTVDGQLRLLEVHLFDFSGDLYGQGIEVEFLSFIRPERRFESVEALRVQIARDVEEAGIKH